MRIVLASSSARRRELIASLGLDFAIASPDVDETPQTAESPADYVDRLARAKAAAIEADDDTLVIAADTTVVLDGEIIGKPVGRADAVDILTRLAGNTHRVLTGVAVRRSGTVAAGVDITDVTFTPLSAETIEWYVDREHVYDKAGAYGMQGAAGAFVARLHGSASNVIGLPLHLVVRLAAELGVDLLGGRP